MSVIELLTLCFVQAKLSHFQAHNAAAATYDAIVNEEEERFFLGGLFRPRAPRRPEGQAALLAALRAARRPAAPTTGTNPNAGTTLAARLAPAVITRRMACVNAGMLTC